MDFDLDAGTWAAIAATAAEPRAQPPAAQAGLPVGWKEELLAEAGGPARPRGSAPLVVLDEPPSAPPGWIPPVIGPGSVGARPSPLAPGERKRLPMPARQADLPPRLPGWTPGERPRNRNEYVQLLDWVWGPQTEAFMRAIASEPLFTYAARRWRPAAQGEAWWADEPARAANLEILQVLYDRLSALMATYWDFDPAPLAYVPTLNGSVLGIYFPRAGAIGVSSRLIGAPLCEVVNTIAHEQTHALQGSLLHRIDGGLEPYVRSLVAYWAHEMPRLRSIPYLDRGLEIHAFQVGDAAGDVARAL